MDVDALVNEIGDIKGQLNAYHDVDPDYIPPLVRELRNYIFQVHAGYEQSMQILVRERFLRNDVPYEVHLELFEKITFENKMRLVVAYDANFPIKKAKKLNILRNEFAHKNGTSLRNEYDDDTRLKVYRFLKKANDALNDYWRAHTPTSNA